MKVFCVLLLVLQALQLSLCATDKIVCYFGIWATYRYGNGNFEVENINPNLCTHIIYTFLGLSSNGFIRQTDPYYDNDKRGLARFVELKNKNPNVKLMIAIWGWNEGSTTYSNVFNNPTLRKTFVNDVIVFLQRHRLDGFDLDWEYPGQRGGVYSDKAAFVALTKELRTEFDRYGYLLTAGVAATASHIAISYDVPNLNKYLDWFNIMTYDLRGSYDGYTGQHSGLYPSTTDSSAVDKTLNTDASIRAWIQAGASPSKIVVGVPFYGRTYTLASTSNNGVRALTIGAGTSGPYTQENGHLSYLEICEKQKQGGWTTVWNEAQQVPYTFKGNQWVGYENPQSVRVKTAYAKANNLGGIMMWSIESEDAKNICGGGSFPLLTAINDEMKLNSSPQTTTSAVTSTTITQTTTTTKSTTTTTKPTTAMTTTTAKATTIPIPNTTLSTCPPSGYYLDPNNCAAYYRCSTADSEVDHRRFQCPKSTKFNINLLVCEYGTC